MYFEVAAAAACCSITETSVFAIWMQETGGGDEHSLTLPKTSLCLRLRINMDKKHIFDCVLLHVYTIQQYPISIHVVVGELLFLFQQCG